MSNPDDNKSLVVFQNKSIRRVMVDDEWFFSVIDVVAVLTDSANPRDYWFKMKKRVHSEDEFELSTICRQLKLPAPDGKMRTTDCANVKGLFRIIQSIPSPKAEPFKQWLAQVGYDRVLEIENPELAQERMKDLYEQKGYPKDWIDKRLRGIAIRQNLTDEWKERGITEDRDFAILTAEISKATFGMTPSAYKAYKGLDSPRQNLRDHMTDLELIFTMLGERVTTELSPPGKARGYGQPQIRRTARRKGRRKCSQGNGKGIGTFHHQPEKLSAERQIPRTDCRRRDNAG